MKATSIFLKIFASMILIAIFCGMIILLITLTQRAESVEDALIQEHQQLAEVASQIIESGYAIGRIPFRTLKQISDSPKVIFLWIVKPNGEIFYANDPEMFGKYIIDSSLGQNRAEVRDSTHLVRGLEENIKLIVHPLQMTERRVPWGLYLGLSLEPVRASQRSILINGILLLFGVILITSAISYYLAKTTTSSLEELKKGAVAIGKGNLTYRIHVKTDDEIEELADTFNTMTKELDRRNTELQYERDKIAAIINNLASGIILHDNDNKIILMNPQAERMVGVLQKDVEPEGVTSTLIKNNPRLKSLYKIVSSKVKPKHRKEYVIEETEKLVVQISSVELILKEKKSPLTIKLLYDVTREKQIERLKSEFISIASHQLRTPLSIIKWTLKMYLDGDVGPITDAQKDFLLKTYRSNQRMIDLVNDLLNVSRIEEGRLHYQFIDVNIARLIDEKVKEYAVLKHKKKISLKLDVKAIQNLTVLADPEKINLAFANVIDNAIKFTLPGGTVKIKGVQKGKKIEISIADNGIGISTRDQHRIFKKFFRAESAMRMQTQGTGLGLFIAKNVIKKHKGTIELRSKLGKGTVVTISLPVS